jgi:hypothetical protein
MLALALLLSVMAAPSVEPQPRFCFAREEDNGLMNVVSARIFGQRDGQRRRLATLSGGTHRCVSVTNGDWVLEVRSVDAYKRGTDPNACRSPHVSVTTNRSIVRFRVAPLARGSTYLCGWTLERR